ncbi:MAG: diacylglycerol kinase family lipid kinase [Alphaproteobacteria bacterium]|nr:diacylglycerol kinase family lipid kinase [Alphaproteobacteria bacterium]
MIARAEHSTGARLLVVHNPISGWPVAGWFRRRLLARVVARLRRAGARVEVRRTAARGDAERFARAALAQGFERIVVAGGDGTINEAANALAGSALPLAVVPLGTANVLAAEIGLGGGADAIARVILDGRPARVSLGAVGGRRFVMMAGIGFDARVVRAVDPAAKRWLGKLAYVAATLAELGRFRPRRYAITADGRRFEAGSVIVAKGRHYAGNFVAAPDARLDDACFQVCLFRAGDRRAILRYATALARGRLHRLDDVTIVAARSVMVERLGDSAVTEPVQGDGDIVGRLPVRIAVLPHALTLMVPAESPLGRAAPGDAAPARLAARG